MPSVGATWLLFFTLLILFFTTALSETTVRVDTYPVANDRRYQYVSFLIRDLPHGPPPSSISFTFSDYWKWVRNKDRYAGCKVNDVNIDLQKLFVSTSGYLGIDFNAEDQLALFPSNGDSVLSVECPFVSATLRSAARFLDDTIAIKINTFTNNIAVVPYNPATSSPFFPKTLMNSHFIKHLPHSTINTVLNVNVTNSYGSDQWDPLLQDAHFEITLSNCKSASVLLAPEFYRSTSNPDESNMASRIQFEDNWIIRERGSNTIFTLHISKSYLYELPEGITVKQYQIRTQFQCKDTISSNSIAVTHQLLATSPRTEEKINPIVSIKEVKFIEQKLEEVAKKILLDQNVDYLQLKIDNLTWGRNFNMLKLKAHIFDQSFTFSQPSSPIVCLLHLRNAIGIESENPFANVDIELIKLDDPINFNGQALLFPETTSQTALITFNRIDLGSKWVDGAKITVKCKDTKIISVWKIEESEHSDRFVLTTLESPEKTPILRQNALEYKYSSRTDPDPDPEEESSNVKKCVIIAVVAVLLAIGAFVIGELLTKREVPVNQDEPNELLSGVQ
jgi:hypothetical protein